MKLHGERGMELAWNQRNEIVATWPLIGSLMPITYITAIYLMLVLRILPEYMKDRKPFNLSLITRAYNIFQVAACSFFAWNLIKHGGDFSITWKCIPTYGKFPEEYLQLNKLQYYFIYLRLIEYIETVFFILRKKFNQVSPLHVYHHISTVYLLIIFLKYSGGVMELYFGSINSIVHIFMYSYYFLSSFRNLTKFTNLVKPFLTLIQIAQLVIVLGHCIAAVLPSCKTVHSVFYLQICNISLLLILFGNFYVQNFVRKKAKAV